MILVMKYRVCLSIAISLIALGIGVVISAETTGSDTFYVAINGSDSAGTGSSATPWATITHAVDNVPDGSLVLVRPGLYSGRVRLRRQFANGITVRSEVPYQAQLRNNATVVTSFYGQGITLEGFDIAHDGAGAGGLVVQIQDLLGEPGGTERVSRIVLKNNVIHDSYNNDLLKINNGAAQITVTGNLFYNQTGSDEHIDVNSVIDVTIQDNIFFNDFTGSGRINQNNTSSYIVIKDSNDDGDGEKLEVVTSRCAGMFLPIGKGQRAVTLCWSGKMANRTLRHRMYSLKTI